MKASFKDMLSRAKAEDKIPNQKGSTFAIHSHDDRLVNFLFSVVQSWKNAR